MKKRLEAQAKIEAGKKKIEWGSQIRSYVFDDRRVILNWLGNNSAFINSTFNNSTLRLCRN